MKQANPARPRFDSPMTGEKRWTIFVPEWLHFEIRTLAAKEGVTIKQLVTEALLSRLKKTKKD